MALKEAGPQPLGFEALQLHRQGGNGPGTAGVATGEAARMGLVTAARAANPAQGARHQHGGARAQQGQPRHGQADAGGPGAAVEGRAVGPQQGAIGAGGEALGAAHRHQAVFDNAPVQQQPATADAIEVQAALQLPARVQGGGVAAGAQVQLLTGQQGGQHLGAATAERFHQAATNRHHQVGAAVATPASHPIELEAADADRWITGAQVEHQAGLVRELGIAGHHHVGGGVGRLQPFGGHLLAES